MEAGDETALDAAHGAMMAEPGDDALRLRYHGLLADTLLFLWLRAEARGGALDPRVFDLDCGPVVLAADSEDRLAAMAGQAVPYAALPGRVVAQGLAGQGVALGINLGTPERAYLVPPEGIDWLAATLGHAPAMVEDRPRRFAPPGDLPQALLAGLGERLGGLAGRAGGAMLARAGHAGGHEGLILAFLDAAAADEAALAGAVAEALVFSGWEAGQIDVAFLAADDPAAQAMAQVALRLDMAPLPPAAQPAPTPRTGPPRLR
jgi:hypothetical protein